MLTIVCSPKVPTGTRLLRQASMTRIWKYDEVNGTCQQVSGQEIRQKKWLRRPVDYDALLPNTLART